MGINVFISPPPPYPNVFCGVNYSKQGLSSQDYSMVTYPWSKWIIILILNIRFSLFAVSYVCEARFSIALKYCDSGMGAALHPTLLWLSPCLKVKATHLVCLLFSGCNMWGWFYQEVWTGLKPLFTFLECILKLVKLELGSFKSLTAD